MQYSQAEQILKKALDKARELKVNISVWVLDASASPMAFAKMDGAGPMTPEIARRKAYTSAMTGRNSGEWAESMKGRAEVMMSIMSATNGMMAPMLGGVVIKRGNEVLGSVAASGATGEQDQECAMAGASVMA